MQEKFIQYIAAELNLSQDQTDIARYGLHSFIGTLLALLAVLPLSAAAGILPEAMAVFFVGMSYRKLSGGAHCHTLLRCLTVGTFVTISLAWLGKAAAPVVMSAYLLIIFPSLLAAAAAYFYAPADVPQKPITSPTHRTFLRRFSFLYVFLWFISGNYLWLSQNHTLLHLYIAGNLSLLWQSFLLTPPGYKLIALLSLLFSPNRITATKN